MDENNQVIPNLPEKLSGYGYISGIVTTDNLDGATPAAFLLTNRSVECLKKFGRIFLTVS